ncbi:alpha/beta fold hydrolase [Longirhabdus pacifica]|uniref:alpha/beta fold hydrolase n=1 Tax=Longirhabdus pacifica TaxID=2305227 RepID=UPI001008AD13|nr:alpha/beta hydrolase [Longirhabdus pacifica]
MWKDKTINMQESEYFIRERITNDENAKNLLLLHGLGWTSEIWSSTARIIKKHYRIIAPDLAGHGNSSDAPSYEFDTLAEHLTRLLEALNIEKTVVVASSWGADLAVKFSSMYPQYVEHLVLLDGGYHPVSKVPGLQWEMLEQQEFPEEALQDLSSFFTFMKSDDPDLWNEDIEHAVRDQVNIREDGKVTFKLKREAQIACLKTMWDFDPFDAENTLKVPTTVVVAMNKNESSEMRDFKLKQSHAFCNKNNAKEVILENTDHLIMLDSPQKVAAFI